MTPGGGGAAGETRATATGASFDRKSSPSRWLWSSRRRRARGVQIGGGGGGA